jgi:hypothetical protein
MSEPHPRMRREARTIEAMTRIYCRDHHTSAVRLGGQALCISCTELLEYARRRLARCPYQERKPTCAKCPIHCYEAGRRDEIRAVMRYAGPRMMLRHPYLAILHLLDRARKPSPKRIAKPQKNPPSPRK